MPRDDERFEDDDRARRPPDRDDDYVDRIRQPPLTGMDKFFKDTNMFLLVLLSVCCSLIGLILGVIGLSTCKDPDAKQRATVVTIISGIMFAIGILSNFARLANFAK
jgi:hypothetical protein